MLHGLDDILTNCALMWCDRKDFLVDFIIHLVIKPITRDEELNVITKELTEERKRLNLDYDAYRRASQAATAPRYSMC